MKTYSVCQRLLMIDERPQLPKSRTYNPMMERYVCFARMYSQPRRQFPSIAQAHICVYYKTQSRAASKVSSDSIDQDPKSVSFSQTTPVCWHGCILEYVFDPL